MRIRTGIAIAAAAGAGLGYGELRNSDNKPVDALKATEAIAQSGNNFQAKADELCATDPYTAQEYKGRVGSDLVADLGKTGANKVLEFEGNASSNSGNVAKQLAPNNAGISVISVILRSEKGVKPGQVVEEASEVFGQMESNDEVRKRTCSAVIARVLATPKLYRFQSRTGKIAEYSPRYAGDNLDGIDAVPADNTSEVQLFGIAPVKGSKFEARDTATSNSWGITAEGEVIQASEDEGEAKVTKRGKPVKVRQDKTGAPAGARNQEQDQEGGANQQQQQQRGKSNNGKSGGACGGCGNTQCAKCGGTGPKPAPKPGPAPARPTPSRPAPGAPTPAPAPAPTPEQPRPTQPAPEQPRPTQPAPEQPKPQPQPEPTPTPTPEPTPEVPPKGEKPPCTPSEYDTCGSAAVRSTVRVVYATEQANGTYTFKG